MRTIVHVDMDAFFASVEQLDDPKLRGKPVLVGADSPRGVVAAASYEAREFGIHSAMPMVQARRLCPTAVVVSPNRGRYVEASRAVFDVFERYTPMIEGLSLDEAFLDVSASRSLFGDGEAIAKKVKADVFDTTNLRASAGVASSKFVAKIASDLHKPDGLTVVQTGDEAEFLAPLPLKRMWRLGPKACDRLQRLGFRTIGDLAAASEEALVTLLGKWGHDVFLLARGIDDRDVVVSRKAKSVGAEHTFEQDLRTVDALRTPILAQCIRVADRLALSGRRARVVTLKIKYGDHQVRTRQLQLPVAIADPDTIYEAACQCLSEFDDLQRGVRLTGVSVSSFGVDAQASLFEDEKRERRQTLENVTAKLRSRFGDRGLTRARLLDDKSR